MSRSLNKVHLATPVTDEAIAKLKIGDVVFLSGVIYTGREGVYKRILDDGVESPVDIPSVSNVNFHCSPAASVREDGSYNMGAVTATASFRFARWLPDWFAKTQCRVIIGKGGMSSEDYKAAFVPNNAVYLTTVGYGTGALLGRGIKHVRDAVWLDELGIAQAMWILEVDNFGPLLVESDIEGNSLFESQNALINDQIEAAYAGLKKPALSRYGETDDKTEELI